MPDYVCKALHRFQHILIDSKEQSLHFCDPIQYGQKIQYADPLGTLEYLPDKETNTIQQVCVTFLYYAIAIDNIILPYLIDISSEQSKAKKKLQNR